MGGNRRYDLKPNNNLLTNDTPTLRNHEIFSYGSGVHLVHDQCKIFNSSILHKVSKDISSRTTTELRIMAKQGPSFFKSRCCAS